MYLQFSLIYDTKFIYILWLLYIYNFAWLLVYFYTMITLLLFDTKISLFFLRDIISNN